MPRNNTRVNKTRKLKGGMFEFFRPFLQTGRRFLTGAKAPGHASKKPTGRAALASGAPFRAMSGKPTVSFGQAVNPLAGLTSARSQSSKLVKPQLSYEEFMSGLPTAKRIDRLRTTSAVKILKEKFGMKMENNIPANSLRPLLKQKYLEAGELVIEGEVVNTPAVSSQSRIQNSINQAKFGPGAASIVSAGPKIIDSIAIAKGQDFINTLAPATAKQIRQTAEKIKKNLPPATPVLPELLQTEYEAVLLSTKPNKKRLNELKASELLYWEPLRRLIFTFANVPGMRGVMSRTGAFRSVLLPANLMIDSSNFDIFEQDPTLKELPTQAGYKKINQDVFDILRKKLSYEPDFNPRKFRELFNIGTLQRLKTGIVRCYIQNDEDLAKRILVKFLDCANSGHFYKKPQAYKQFLELLDTDANAAFNMLSTLQKTASAHEQEMSTLWEKTLLHAKAWFGGRTYWAVIVGLGVTGIALLLGYAGIPTGTPLDPAISGIIRLATITTDRVQVALEQSRLGALGRMVAYEQVKPVMEEAIKKGVPYVEPVQKRLEEVTDPYMPKPFYITNLPESLRNWFTRKNSTKPIVPMLENEDTRQQREEKYKAAGYGDPFLGNPRRGI